MGSDRMRRVRPEVIVIVAAAICIVASVIVGVAAYLNRVGNRPAPAGEPVQATVSSLAAEPAEPYEFTMSDLDGLVSGLGNVAVLQGAEQVDLLALVTYDNTVITGVELDTGLLDFATQSQVSVTYTVTADAGALAQHLGVDNPAQTSGAVTLHTTGRVYVISEAEAWDFHSRHPDVAIYGSGNSPYEPQPPEELPEEETPTEEVPLEEETEPAEQPEQKPQQTQEQPQQTQEQPQQPAHTHSWQPVYGTVHHDAEGHYETRTITEAYDEPVYESMEVCSACGATYAPGTGMSAHIQQAHGGEASSSVQQMQTDSIHHAAVTEEVWVVDREAYDEQVITGYSCSCGATK